MKNLFCFLILALFSFSTSYSQITWNQQTSGTYENLNGVYLVDANTGYAVGNNGIILKTTNAGQTWTTKTFPVSTNNLCVHFQNASTGFVGNQNSFVYKTIDGGNNWEADGSASNYAITSVQMTSANTGYLGDHYSNIQKTTDNGLTWWTLTTTPGYDAKIFFMNDNRGWNVDSYGYIYTTQNAGINWTSSRISTDTLSSVYFISSTIGYVAGDSGRVFKTINGGTNWTLLNTGTTVKLNSIYVQNLNYVFACGDAGTIITSTNGGTNWTIETHGTQNLKNIYFISPTIIGSAVGNAGAIFRTNVLGYGCVGTGNTPVGYPFYTYYMDSRTDILFLANELNSYGVTQGPITQLGFNFTSADTLTMNGFNIKFQLTSLPALVGFTNTGWSVAYSGTYKVPGTGLKYINLTTPFYWDGTSNLLIEICFNNSVWTNNSNVNSSDATNMTYHQHLDLPAGDGCTGITTGLIQATRPNICFSQTISGTAKNNNPVPDKYYLSQNYPNPFNPTTKISFSLPKSGYITLKVYDILGKEVTELINETKQAGNYIVDFNALDLTSGVYFYKLESEGFSDIKKMIFLK
jgi:photosystem II stability/assembly factor-like uncharacterized protein